MNDYIRRDNNGRRIIREAQATFWVALFVIGASVYAAAGTHWLLKTIDRKRS